MFEDDYPSGRGVPFYSSCVEWPKELLDALEFIVDEGEEISRATFMEQADISREHLGDWFPGAKDYHIGYRSLAKKGLPIYYFVHSATEFVYALPEDIQAAQVRQGMLLEPTLTSQRAL